MVEGLKVLLNSLRYDLFRKIHCEVMFAREAASTDIANITDIVKRLESKANELLSLSASDDGKTQKLKSKTKRGGIWINISRTRRPSLILRKFHLILSKMFIG